MDDNIFNKYAKQELENIQTAPAKDNFFQFEALDNDGKLRKMSEFSNKKALLVVNVACKCGLTSEHYKQLVDIYKKYKARGLEILAFPSNDFLEQEPWDNSKIKEYIQTNFNVDFQLFDKIAVNGEDCHEIYKFLRFNSELHDPKTNKTKQIPWNFSKFLINPQGKIVKYINPKYNPEVMIPDIEALLDA